MKDITNESQFLFYNGRDGKLHAQVIVGEETVGQPKKHFLKYLVLTVL